MLTAHAGVYENKYISLQSTGSAVASSNLAAWEWFVLEHFEDGFALKNVHHNKHLGTVEIVLLFRHCVNCVNCNNRTQQVFHLTTRQTGHHEFPRYRCEACRWDESPTPHPDEAHNIP